jgi:hypothetical protein
VDADAPLTPSGVAFEKHRVTLHDAMNPLSIDRRMPGLRIFAAQQGGDTATPVGCPLIDEAADDRQQRVVLGLEVWTARRCRALRRSARLERATPNTVATASIGAVPRQRQAPQDRLFACALAAEARFQRDGVVLCKCVPGRSMRGDCLFHIGTDAMLG